MIQRILTNQSYISDVVNVKTYSSRGPRHASREQIIVLFKLFPSRFFASVGKWFDTIYLDHKNRRCNLLAACNFTKILKVRCKPELQVHS